MRHRVSVRHPVLSGAVMLGAAVALAIGAASPAVASPPEGKVQGAGAPDAISERYLVGIKDSALKSTTVETVSKNLARRYGGSPIRSFTTAIRGYAVKMTENQAKRLAADPSVSAVEQDKVVRNRETQSSPPWGLDRIDQAALPLNSAYTYPSGSTAVRAYVLDTGVRISHEDFGGRASYGYDFIDNDSVASDCQGHGTHVAGTIGGKVSGVAKNARIVAVRVLDCQGTGSTSAIVAGIDWVTKNAVKPAVANMSLGGSSSRMLDEAVERAVAAGVTFAVAAGNESKDACGTSPARTPNALTVGSTTSSDARSSFSNYGSCLDLFAPGSSIRSSTFGSDSSYGSMSGTSMATPHVAGAVALYLSGNPGASPSQVASALLNRATSGVVTSPQGSPNKLLRTVTQASEPTQPEPTQPEPTQPEPTQPEPTQPEPTQPEPTQPPVDGPTCDTFSATPSRQIPDRGWASSTINVSRCDGRASQGSKVTVRVSHPRRGDLEVWLIAPNGQMFPLKATDRADRESNLDAGYSVDLSGVERAGRWTLRVNDRYRGSRGVFDSWSLTI